MYIKTTTELNTAKDVLSNRFKIVTDTKAHAILDFSYSNNEAVYEIDTRLTNYNELVVNDFWEHDYLFFEDDLNYINSDNYFTVINYEGKRFWVVENYFLKYETDTHFTYLLPENKKKKDVLERLKSSIELTLTYLEIRGFVYNELEIGSVGDEYYNYNLFNLDLLNNLYDEDLYACGNAIITCIDYDKISFSDTNNYNSDVLKDVVTAAYKAVLQIFADIEAQKEHDTKLNADYMLAASE